MGTTAKGIEIPSEILNSLSKKDQFSKIYNNVQVIIEKMGKYNPSDRLSAQKIYDQLSAN